ncbi:hypothetical protein [Heyndrickxia camelliae]|uniref:hypothetical protein n=1 Tax=Heyndrickxia camelliae TaxID=1707093 RepID=UPI0013FD4E92|nr:hypothetical protein [Heyndrickxia camelliae]
MKLILEREYTKNGWKLNMGVTDEWTGSPIPIDCILLDDVDGYIKITYGCTEGIEQMLF